MWEKIHEAIKISINLAIQFDPMDVCKLLHRTPAEHALSLSAQGALPSMDHKLGHTANLGQLKTVEIIHRTPAENPVSRLWEPRTAEPNTAWFASMGCGVCPVRRLFQATVFAVGGWGAMGRRAWAEGRQKATLVSTSSSHPGLPSHPLGHSFRRLHQSPVSSYLQKTGHEKGLNLDKKNETND